MVRMSSALPEKLGASWTLVDRGSPPHVISTQQPNSPAPSTPSAEPLFPPLEIQPERSAILFESTGAPFRYLPLEHADSTRLVRLDPSKTGLDVLSLSFLDVQSSGDPEYEVVSGFWGGADSPLAPAPVLVDGRSCQTTAHLAQALYRFRARDSPRLFWVQSLCINVHDIGERNSQVPRIRDILLSAQRLIVWLGYAEDDSDLVFRHLERFEPLRSEYERPLPMPVGSELGFREVASACPQAAALPAALQAYAGDAANAFERLCLRPWFYRPWSIPDVALSKNILIVCGDHQLKQTFPHKNPFAWLLHLYAPPRDSAPFFPRKADSLYGDLNIPPIDAVAHVRSVCLPPGAPIHGHPMGDAYRTVRTCRASNPRDSVFALTLLGPAPPPPPITIDYRLSVSAVYQHATAALVQTLHHGSIQVLRRHASPCRRSPDLPSWALDFDSPLQTRGALWALPGPRFRDEEYSVDHERSDAARTGLWPRDRLVPPLRFECEPFVGRGTLTATGILMETVAGVGAHMPIEAAEGAAADGIHNNIFAAVLSNWELFALRSSLHRTPAPTQTTIANNHHHAPQHLRPLDAFLDTLSANDAHDVLARRSEPSSRPRPGAPRKAQRWYRLCCAGLFLSPSRRDDERIAAETDQEEGGGHDDNGADDDDDDASCQSFGRRVARACAGKHFFVTRQGSMGLGPAGTRAGDVLVFLPTGQFPMVLRPRFQLSGSGGGGGGGADEGGGQLVEGGGDGHEENGSGSGQRTTYTLLGEGFLYDWWRHLAPVFDPQSRAGEGANSHLLTEFVIE